MASIRLDRYEAEDGDLPDNCMCCGEPATERKRRRFTWHPFWVYLFLPLGYVPYVLIAVILTERVRCTTLFCDRHKNHWRWRTWVIWGSFLGILLLGAAGVGLASLLADQIDPKQHEYLFGPLCIAIPVLMLCWLISIPLLQLTEIHPSQVTRRSFVLNRVSPKFVEAVHEYRATYEDDDDRDEEPRPDEPRIRPPHRDDRRR